MNSRRHFLKTALVGGTAATTASIAKGENEPENAPKQPKQVDRRTLGRTGAEVSILGLGLGSAFFKPYAKDRESGEKLLHHALDHGINYWDTSRNYGGGLSEEIMGPVVEKRRKEIYLVSKSAKRDYDSFMREAEESLKALRTDYLDIYHLHNLDPKDDLDATERGAYKAALKLKEEGVIKSFGITGHSGARLLMECIRRWDPDAILTVFPCTRDDKGRYEDELLPLARERKMGVIAMKTVRKARNADLIGSDLIRYAVSLEGIHSTIVGLDTMAHLNENIEMATDFKPLPSEARAQLHRDATIALRDIPTPWEQPGYQDGSLA